MSLIKNAYNGKLYYGLNEGTSAEKEFFTVMPVDGPKKLFFESEEEYKLWFHKQFQYHPERKSMGIQSLNIRRTAWF